MISTASRAIPHPEVVCTVLHNKDAVLLHLGTKKYYSLNETGSRIWALMVQGLTLEEISRELESKYEVAADFARKCVVDLAGELAAEELVRLADE